MTLMLALSAWPAVAQVDPAPSELRLADARLDALLERGSLEALEEAASVYLDLLARTGEALPPEDAVVLNRHLAQLALILPAAVQAQVVGAGTLDQPGQVVFKPGAGAALLTWWRSQDPLPASPQNERLAEHLRRVAFAETRFAADGPTSFDDRGRVFVRYGRPARELDIRFDDPKLIDMVYQPGVAVSPSDFPDNAFWLYRHIDRAGYFLFIKKGEVYELSTTEELLPPVLRYGFNPSGRGQRKSDMALAVMRSVYEQLAMEHPDFATRFNDVDLFVEASDERLGQRDMMQNNRAIVGVLGSGRAGDETGNDPEDGPQAHRLAPHEFTQQMLAQSKMEDDQAVYRREISMPVHYTEVFREAEVLPLSIRTARFLEADGTTRTEIYWSPAPGGLRLPIKQQKDPLLAAWSTDQFLVHLTAIQQTADYQGRETSRKSYLITDLPNVQDVAIPTQTMVVHGDTGLFHLALQWDQHRALASEAGGLQVGPHVKVATHRLDSLAGLQADERTLELSDLKPIFVNDLAVLDGETPATPYPHQQIWPDLPLGLYFEIYHLAFGDDDQTHFTVTYEIAGRGEGGLLRFLGRGKQERTTAVTPYTGQDRTAREYILLDFSEWEGEGALEVRVQVTDDTTGRQAARSLFFELVNQ